jgi:cation diffusion facilitator CzcD-associated flavoprotein CzcO
VNSALAAQQVEYLIVGAGISGLCLAIQLRRKGNQSFVLLERNAEAGGTWLENAYPNAGCDIPSFLYSFSFAPRYEWSQKYARQPEILNYLRQTAEQFDVVKNIRFSKIVTSADWNDALGRWVVTVDSGEVYHAQFLVSAVGQLNVPRYPDIPGREQFQGEQWHSARWKKDSELTGRTVAVIGNGASSIQFLPEVSEKASRVILFQRTPSWIHPLHNYRYPAWATWAFKNLPLVALLHRLWIFLSCEFRIIAFWKMGLAHHIYHWWLLKKMRQQVPEEKREVLIPDYPPGCKRVLLSSDFLQIVQRPNFSIVSAPITGIDADAIVTDSKRYPVDVIIYGTGFEATNLLGTFPVKGRGGRSLQQVWAGRPRTLFGITTPEFPNFFMLYGPNSNLGHNSIIYMIESQVSYILKCVDHMRQHHFQQILVRSEAVDTFDRWLQQRLSATVWAAGCSSWYKTAEGTIPNNWSGSALSYRTLTRQPDFASFEFHAGPTTTS